MALRSSRLDAAYLDVTDPEPLPVDHPLWSAPNCYVTPHIGGTHSNEEERLVQHFLKNLAAFRAGPAAYGSGDVISPLERIKIS